MTGVIWLPIKYREFYDIPRVFLVDFQGSSFFFDCPFDDNLDNYPDFFTVYRLRNDLRDQVESLSWKDLSNSLEKIGVVYIDKVEFDVTKRGFVADRIFEQIIMDTAR